MIGLVSSANRPDAYGLAADAPYDGGHLIIEVKQSDFERGGADRTFSIVTFDEADIFGTFREAGHPGVIGLWLNASSVEAYGGDPRDLDPFDYVVPDLLPADNAYMYVRGFVWSPGHINLPLPYP